jgi:hypothetical protein
MAASRTDKPRISPLFTWRSAVAESDDLPATAKLVALTLSLYMSELGDSAFPSQATLAKRTSLNEQTVKKQLRELRRLGWLVVVANASKGRPVQYAAAIPDAGGAETTPSPSESTKDGGEPVGGVENTGVGGVENTGEGGAEDTAYHVRDHANGTRQPCTVPARVRSRMARNDREALHALVAEVSDSKKHTYGVWAHEFGGVLDASHFNHVRDELEGWRRDGVGAGGNEAIDTEAGFVTHKLRCFVNGYDSLPPDTSWEAEADEGNTSRRVRSLP